MVSLYRQYIISNMPYTELVNFNWEVYLEIFSANPSNDTKLLSESLDFGTSWLYEGNIVDTDTLTK